MTRRDRLAELKSSRKWSIQDIADHVGRSNKAVESWLYGPRQIPTHALALLEAGVVAHGANSTPLQIIVRDNKWSMSRLQWLLQLDRSVCIELLSNRPPWQISDRALAWLRTWEAKNAEPPIKKHWKRHGIEYSPYDFRNAVNVYFTISGHIEHLSRIWWWDGNADEHEEECELLRMDIAACSHRQKDYWLRQLNKLHRIYNGKHDTSKPGVYPWGPSAHKKDGI